jgi:hypothetical protein
MALGSPRVIGCACWFSLAPRPIYLPMSFDLTDDEKAALIELLRDTIERSQFVLSPRIKLLRGILEKLAPEPPRPEADPAPKPSRNPRR